MNDPPPPLAPPDGAWTIWVDGQEGDDGQALLLLSVLHLAAGSLRSLRIAVVNADMGALDTALELLRHDCGLEIDSSAGTRFDQESPDKLIYVALRSELDEGFIRRLEILEARGAILLVAIQSVGDSPLRHLLLPEAYAFDTRLFASLLSHLAKEIAEKGGLSQRAVQQLSIEEARQQLPPYASSLSSRRIG